MWKSAKQLLRDILRHWLQLVGGAFLAIIGLVADIKQWTLPPWIWWTAAVLLLAWAMLKAYHEMRLRAETQQADLTGKWFHTIENGELKYQGRVLERRSDKYFIQLFSFVTGDPTTKRYMTDDESRTAHFYDTNEEMRDEWGRRNPRGRRFSVAELNQDEDSDRDT